MGAVALHLTAARAVVTNVAAFLDIAGWTPANEAMLAQAFEANHGGQAAADWAAAAAFYGGQHNPVVRTLRHVAYRARGWPASMNLDGQVHFLRALGSAQSGLVYVLPGVEYPHVTIHDLATDRGPGGWRGAGQDFHVVLEEMVRGRPVRRVHDYQANAYTPFLPPGTPRPLAPNQVRDIARDFWARAI